MTPITARPTDLSPIHLCPVCATCYRSAEEAAACAASTPKPRLRRMDVVEGHPSYGWTNRPELSHVWRAKEANQSDSGAQRLKPSPHDVAPRARSIRDQPTFKFRYVVLGVQPYAHGNSPSLFYDNRDAHRLCYTVFSLGTDNGGLRLQVPGAPDLSLSYGFGGYTTDEGHYYMRRVDDNLAEEVRGSLKALHPDLFALADQHNLVSRALL